MALITGVIKNEGRREQAAKDKAVADALESEYREIADKPRSVDDAIARLRARSRRN